MPSPRSLALSCCVFTLFTVGCQKPSQPVGPQRIENQAMGFVLGDIATGCSLIRNAGTDLELACELDGVVGTLTFELGEQERGVNLLEKAKQQKDWFLSQPAGEFSGNRELGTPIGAAYTARGRYSSEGEAVEESQVLTLHPEKNRAILVRYRYPPEKRKGTQERMEQLLFVVGEIQSIEVGEPEAPAA